MLSKYSTTVCVIGGGQAGISCGYYLNKLNIPYIIVDSKNKPGGSWQTYWKSLQLFSPAKFSFLAGDSYFMNDKSISNDDYLTQPQITNYIEEYENRNKIKTIRPVYISSCSKTTSSKYILKGNSNKNNIEIECDIIISCTGNIDNPFIPKINNLKNFKGDQIHSKDYQCSSYYKDKNVLIVGEGNSGAQILGEIGNVARSIIWMTKDEPSFYRDEIDGRILFEEAHKYRRLKYDKSVKIDKTFKFSSIIMLDSVKKARENGYFKYRMPIISKFTENGVIWDTSDNNEIVNHCAKYISHLKISNNEIYADIDSVIWCTGFRPVLNHLGNLLTKNPMKNIRNECQSTEDPNIYFVGYGDWVGFGSGSLSVVPYYAKDVVDMISNKLNKE